MSLYDPKITNENFRFFLLDFNQKEMFAQKRKQLMEEIEQIGICEHCERKTGTEKWRQARTCYPFNEHFDIEDPNRDNFYCDECDDEDEKYWRYMWEDYYGKLL